jgi:hypothetical protein
MKKHAPRLKRERGVGNGNLTPFKKGEKRASEMGKIGAQKSIEVRDFAALMRKSLEDEIKKGFSANDSMRRVLIRQGRKGSIHAIRELWDRAYGKPKSGAEVTGAGGGPIVHEFKFIFSSDDE